MNRFIMASLVSFILMLAAGKRKAFDGLKFVGLVAVFFIVFISINEYTYSHEEIRVEADIKAQTRERFTGEVDETTRSEIVLSSLHRIKTALEWQGKFVPKPLSKITPDTPKANAVTAFESLIEAYRPADVYLMRFGITSETTFDVFTDNAIASKKSKCLFPDAPCNLANADFNEHLTKQLEKQLLFTAPSGFKIDSSSESTVLEQLKRYFRSNPSEFPSFYMVDTGRYINTIEEAERHYINDYRQSCLDKRNWCISKLGMNEKQVSPYPSQ
jgi:hypothetical protein